MCVVIVLIQLPICLVVHLSIHSVKMFNVLFDSVKIVHDLVMHCRNFQMFLSLR